MDEDLEPYARMLADEEAARFVGGVQSRSGTWRQLAAIAGSWWLRGYGMFSVVEKSSGRWIGRLGPWMPEGWPGPEVGWGLVRSAWGKGYATEGSAAAIDWAFDHLGWTRVIHCIDPDNHASIAVARRLGSTVGGRTRLPAPFDNSDVDLWGQSREQWRSRAQAAAGAARRGSSASASTK
jgi:RimJ/RimL family protein N-acetyltransferase